MKSMKFVTAAVIATFAFPVFAQTTSTPRIDQRQKEQQQRIDQGVKSGQLNRKEAARLEKGQERIQKMENKAMADGKVSAKERAKIEKAQDRESKRIFREKHDKQTAKK
jgi:Tfp pilus assembly protein FimT